MTINEQGNSLDDPTVMDTATVTVKEAVDGTRPVRRRRQGRRRSSAARTTPAAIHERHVKVDAEVMAMAKSIRLPSQRIKIVDHNEVWVVNS
jgi:hypothetical protein